jgi:hypothetical protein
VVILEPWRGLGFTR